MLCVVKRHSPHLKDLKTSNIQDTDERRPLAFGSVQSLVDAVDQPAEQTLICCLGQGFNSEVSLRKNKRGQDQEELL